MLLPTLKWGSFVTKEGKSWKSHFWEALTTSEYRTFLRGYERNIFRGRDGEGQLWETLLTLSSIHLPIRLQYQCFREAVLHRPSFKLIYDEQFHVAGTFNMAVGFGIVTVAFLATFAKYFSKRWFIWVMGILIAAEVAMFLNAGNQKKSRESEEN